MQAIVLLVLLFCSVITEAYAVMPSSGSTFAQPQQSGARPGPTKDPLNDPSYKQCGQDCINERANENIFFQTAFIRKKMDYVSGGYLFDEQLNPGEGKKKRKELLGHFCWKKPWAKVDESDDDCADRYLKTQELWLTRARGSMTANNKNQYVLSCDATHTCKTVKILQSDNDEDQKKDQLIHFPKSQELALTHIVDTPKAFSIQNLEPQKDDFVKYTLVNLNSSDPLSEKKFEVPLVVGGHIQYDEEAYKRAHDQWLRLQGTESPVLPLSEVQASRAKFQAEFQGPKSQAEKSIHRVLYDDVRGEIIKYVNDLDWGGTATAPTKITASAQQTKTNTAPAPLHYTGDEEVKPVRQKGKSHSLIVNPSAVESEFDSDSILPPNTSTN